MKKVLVANRGEIALRIMRTCKDMGIKTVAVFSEVDRTAPFVRYADEAYCIGPPASSESYLVGEKIIDVALQSGAEGIHPGYGFLSENADFAREVTKAGIVFIGPSPESMEVMGDKLAAKSAVKSYNIPMVPGIEEAIADVDKAASIANEIGYPVLIKAAAGGGGKGMRVVEKAEEVKEQIRSAQSEAKSAFGNDAVFIEKFVTSPRHIEIQVLADKHGNYVHLFERECSIQRRHQKVIEEAPSAVLTPELREEMGQCAIDVARSCDYIGAGTVEFLLDADMKFYFLEMNTRLQVEHPVTEMITSIDLVREQILVARGEKLRFSQSDLSIQGHALEVRVYAEDPKNNFLPDIGKLVRYDIPKGPGIRVDDGLQEDMDIPIYYDPMIAKLITHGKDREEAIDRMLRAIGDYQIAGVTTTLPFCAFALKHKAFTSGNFDTHFVNQYFKPELLTENDPEEEKVAAMLVGKLFDKHVSVPSSVEQPDAASSNWKRNRKQ